MTQQRRFTKEFEDEAVRLVQTTGWSQREIAEDLGIGLSTLVRWISRSRDRQIDAPDRSGQEDVAAELKRLRRENEILRPAPGLIHHADCSSQYCSADYQAELRKHGILTSMSSKGNCYDCETIRATWRAWPMLTIDLVSWR